MMEKSKMDKDTIPYFEDAISARKDGFPIVERETVNVVVWDPETSKVLCLDWGKFGWRTFIIGGVENGEEAKDAAQREIIEETGYDDLEFVADLGRLRSGYFAAHKNENRIANTTALLFRLKSSRQKTVANQEVLPHTFHWISKTEVRSYLTLSSAQYIWDQAQTYL